jgi:hypothetical protein
MPPNQRLELGNEIPRRHVDILESFPLTRSPSQRKRYWPQNPGEPLSMVPCSVRQVWLFQRCGESELAKGGGYRIRSSTITTEGLYSTSSAKCTVSSFIARLSSNHIYLLSTRPNLLIRQPTRHFPSEIHSPQT